MAFQEEIATENKVDDRLKNVLARIKALVGVKDKQVAELKVAMDEIRRERGKLLDEIYEAKRELREAKEEL
ncbi:MAG: hypothetical protein ACTSR2_14865 [Candidatus Hodarchaeales archaeon]